MWLFEWLRDWLKRFEDALSSNPFLPDPYAGLWCNDHEAPKKSGCPDTDELLKSYERLIEARFGPRCEVCMPRCGACMHWKIYDLVKESLGDV